MFRLSTIKPTPLTGFVSVEGDCDTVPGLKTTPDKGRMSSLREPTATQYADGVS